MVRAAALAQDRPVEAREAQRWPVGARGGFRPSRSGTTTSVAPEATFDPSSSLCGEVVTSPLLPTSLEVSSVAHPAPTAVRTRASPIARNLITTMPPPSRGISLPAEPARRVDYRQIWVTSVAPHLERQTSGGDANSWGELAPALPQLRELSALHRWSRCWQPGSDAFDRRPPSRTRSD